jgi:hypothetical protein
MAGRGPNRSVITPARIDTVADRGDTESTKYPVPAVPVKERIMAVTERAADRAASPDAGPGRRDRRHLARPRQSWLRV